MSSISFHLIIKMEVEMDTRLEMADDDDEVEVINERQTLRRKAKTAMRHH